MSDLTEAKESIFEILALTRKSLVMPEPSVGKIDAFLMGYQLCLGDRGMVPRHLLEFHEFQGEWLATRLGQPFPSPLGWAMRVRQSFATEHDAFVGFFELMDEFCRQKGITITPLA